MSNQSLPVGSSPKVVIEAVAGDLSVVGWEAGDLLVKADDDQARVRQDGDTVYLSCNDDLSVRLPKDASLEVQNVGGDMALRGVYGSVQLREVRGDLSIRDVDSVSVASAREDFSLRGAKGTLRVGKIGSDASVREVGGDVTLESIGGDLALRGVGGNLKATVGADVVAYLEPKSNHEYTIAAGDDLLLVLPHDTDATLTLSGDEISVDWPGVPQEDSSSRVIQLGSGAAKVTLSAGDDLRVTGQERAAETADEFGNFAGAMFDWADFGRDFGRDLSEAITRQVQNATRRANNTAQRAARKAEKASRRASQMAERRGRGVHARVSMGRWNWDLAPGGGSGPAPRASVSDEERMVILKMLQEKKITSEEAEKLLSALEGGG